MRQSIFRIVAFDPLFSALLDLHFVCMKTLVQQNKLCVQASLFHDHVIDAHTQNIFVKTLVRTGDSALFCDSQSFPGCFSHAFALRNLSRVLHGLHRWFFIVGACFIGDIGHFIGGFKATLDYSM